MKKSLCSRNVGAFTHTTKLRASLVDQACSRVDDSEEERIGWMLPPCGLDLGMGGRIENVKLRRPGRGRGDDLELFVPVDLHLPCVRDPARQIQWRPPCGGCQRFAA